MNSQTRNPNQCIRRRRTHYILSHSIRHSASKQSAPNHDRQSPSRNITRKHHWAGTIAVSTQHTLIMRHTQTDQSTAHDSDLNIDGQFAREKEKSLLQDNYQGEKDDFDSENSWISGGLPNSSRRERRGEGRGESGQRRSASEREGDLVRGDAKISHRLGLLCPNQSRT